MLDRLCEHDSFQKHDKERSVLLADSLANLTNVANINTMSME
jgi:hypothetical protein